MGGLPDQRWIAFEGHELIEELRAVQAEATRTLCRAFVDGYPASAAQGREQSGEDSFYPRRWPEDSRLDPQRSLPDQFELLRVVDNERYLAFFDWRGQRFILRTQGAVRERLSRERDARPNTPIAQGIGPNSAGVGWNDQVFCDLSPGPNSRHEPVTQSVTRPLLPQAAARCLRPDVRALPAWRSDLHRRAR